MYRYIFTIIAITMSLSFSFARQPRIGITLSGGGALGYAHIGVLQALEEHGIHPDCISGSSMGAIIGTLYAAGYSPKEMLAIVQKDKLYRINKLLTLQSAFTTTGMSSHKSLHRILLQLIPHNSFDSLPRRLTVCVTNLDSGESEYISSGDSLAEYVVASASIPGIFETRTVGGHTYVDGGVLDNLPVRALRPQCDHIIAVDVLPFVRESRKSTSLDVMLWSIRLMQHSNSIPGRAAADWLIDSYALVEFHEFSFDKYREIYQYGYKAATEYLAAHPELIRRCAR
ncbi:MAG: patatin-like phospholipase family protein [bacterium]|uniref:Patatin-like phospholipase family protein n=1 Tax=Candidatus Aphodosoma intestinipullorum TaxID=2840674 RepID=A0A940DNJ9_9BACT|nr:patatin-like phospholipase family protein [Candidatus Aphodosoma intestinipullorum]